MNKEELFISDGNNNLNKIVSIGTTNYYYVIDSQYAIALTSNGELFAGRKYLSNVYHTNKATVYNGAICSEWKEIIDNLNIES